MPALEETIDRGVPQLVGVVEEIVFHNPTNDYTVMEVMDEKKKCLGQYVGIKAYNERYKDKMLSKFLENIMRNHQCLR